MLFVCNVAWSAEQETVSPSNLGFNLDYQVSASYWFTSDDDDSEEGVGHALDYKPELIPAQALRGALTWSGETVVDFRYETAVSSASVDQESILEISDKASSLKKISAFLDLSFMKGRANTLRDTVSRLRVEFKSHEFAGKADVQESTRYIAADSSSTLLSPGDEIRFKSDFEEVSVTYATDSGSRFGFYQTVALKPHETSLYTLENTVLETEITGTGLKFIRESESSTVFINVGQVKFRANQSNYRSDGFDFLVGTEWRPQYYLIGSKESATQHGKSSLTLSPYFAFQFALQLGGKAEGLQETDGTEELSMDIIVDGGLRLNYIF